MNTEKTTLEVGDRLYARQYSSYSGPHIIERVTATQAFAGPYKFKRAIQGNWIKQIGGGRWNSTSFHLETPEIKTECRTRVLRSKLQNFNFDKLPLERLERLNAILSEPIAA